MTLSLRPDDISEMPVLKNARHERFAQEFAKGVTLGDAYEKAGYRRHAQNPHRLMKNEQVSARVAEIQGRGAERAAATVERIVQEIENLSFANITDVVEIKGKRVIVKNTADLPREVTSAIAAIKKTKAGIEVRFHDKSRALEMLGRHRGLFRENINLNVTVSLLDLVTASYPEAPKTIEHEPAEDSD